jgi:hypothetical protein
MKGFLPTCIKLFVITSATLLAVTTVFFCSEDVRYQKFNLMVVGSKPRAELITALQSIGSAQHITPDMLRLPGLRIATNSLRAKSNNIVAMSDYSTKHEWAYYPIGKNQSVLQLFFDKLCITKNDISRITSGRAEFVTKLPTLSSPRREYSYVHVRTNAQNPIKIAAVFADFGCLPQIIFVGPT